tara:strand:+ start:10 stop:2442 length:2433 start_codon:yes stop_codon:yes gene_type:complete
MATTTFQPYTGNGTNKTFNYSFPTFTASEVVVEVDGVVVDNFTIPSYQTTGTRTVTFDNGSPSGGTVNTNVCETDGAPKDTLEVIVRRDTSVDAAKADYTAGSSLKAADLTNNNTQILRALQEEQNTPITTPRIRDAAITTAKIKDGTIVNADVNASAAIAGTKISPNFGSQNIVTSGTVDGRDVSVDGAKLDTVDTGAKDDQTASEIKTLLQSDKLTVNEIADDAVTYAKIQNVSATDRVLGRDSSGAGEIEEITPANLRTMINVEDGATADQTAAEIRTLVEAANDSNVFTDDDHSKLNNISAGADVTSTNSINALTDVNTAGVADGKILKYQASSSSFIIADDGGSGGGGASAFTGLSDTPANYGGGVSGKVLKVNSNADGIEFGTALLEDDATPSLKGNLDVEGNEITTTTTNGNIKVSPNGTGFFEVKGNTNAGTLQLNCENNSHGVKIKSPAHSAAASYTLTLPEDLPSQSQIREVLRVSSTGIMDTVPIAFQEQNQVIALYDQTNGGPIQRLLADTEGVTLMGTSSAVSKLMFRDAGNTAYKVKLKAVDTLSADLELTLPAADGTAGQPLQTNGSGVLSFADIDKIKENDSSVEITGTSNNTGIFEVKLQHTSANSYAAATSLRQWNNGTQNRTILNEGNTTKNSLFELNHSWGSNAWSEIQFTQTGATAGSNKIRSDGYSYINFYTDNTGSAKFTLGPSTAATIAYDFIPSTNNAKDLGSTSYKWAEVHATNFYGSGANLTDIGAQGAGSDKIFWENGQTVTQSYTVGDTFGAACNAMSAGPITINNSVVVTVDSGDTWTIV